MSKAIQIKKVEEVKLPKIVVLYFQRADNPEKTVTVKTTMEDSMERVVAIAAEKLGLAGASIGLLGGGEPVELIGKTVGDILREYNTDTFQLASAEMLGLMLGLTERHKKLLAYAAALASLLETVEVWERDTILKEHLKNAISEGLITSAEASLVKQIVECILRKKVALANVYQLAKECAAKLGI